MTFEDDRGPDNTEGYVTELRSRALHESAKVGNAVGRMPSHLLKDPITGNIYERPKPGLRGSNPKAVAKRRAKNKAKRNSR